MAALTAVRDDRRKGPNHAFGLVRYPIAAGVVIYKGAIVAVGADGYLRPARGNVADTVVGVAFETRDNTTGVAGAQDRFGFDGPRVWKTGSFVFNKASAVIADVGKLVYATDDNTVSLTSATGQLFGTVVGVHDSGSLRILIDGKVG